MSTYASASDVTDRWARDATDAENTLITTRLADVERMIERTFRARSLPALSDQIATGALDVDDVVQVEADAVLRLVRNPEGYLSETDGSYTYQLSQDLATGRLEILPDEWETLGVAQTGLFIIAPFAVVGT